MIANLFSASPTTVETMAAFVGTLATAWAVVWLVADRIKNRCGRLGFLWALLVMLAVGLLSYLANSGLPDASSLPPRLVYYGIALASLLAPMFISGRCCRKVYSPKRFMIWLLLWSALAPAVAMFVLIGGMTLLAGAIIGGTSMIHQLAVVPMVVLMGGIWGICLYFVNLPFMLLIFRNTLYRDRFYRAFGLPVTGRSPFATIDHD